MEYNEESMEKAIQAVSEFKADMGGTEIFAPLEDVL